jgi:hypothetical protein
MKEGIDAVEGVEGVLYQVNCNLRFTARIESFSAFCGC